jgi:zinc and cadmium transporter
LVSAENEWLSASPKNMTIVFYCLVVAVVSFMGGCIPLALKINHNKLQMYLSLSGGAMLGAAFFHMLPESATLAGKQFGFWLAFGVIGLYMLERFLSPHSHDISELHDEHCDHKHHEHEPNEKTSSPAAPAIAGWSAVAGLSIHTLLGGVALASAVMKQSVNGGLALAVLLATVLHKPADSFTISTLLIKSGTYRRRIFLVQIFFASLIPLGAALFHLGKTTIPEMSESAFTGCVLAFSAGTFLCIALSDLLPEVQFHSHDRIRLSACVILGAAFMWATSLIEPSHAHGKEDEDEHSHLNAPEQTEPSHLPSITQTNH